MNGAASDIEAMAVVIPVRNEQDLLERCLESVRAAAEVARENGTPVSLWVVLDVCTDESARIAAKFPAATIAVDARSVGVARAAGVRAALRTFRRVPLERVWIAHTDADSMVPAHWLIHQAALADSGADVVVGTVRPDFRDLSAAQIDAWHARHVPGVANGHVHGANLGTRASVLVEAGGFPRIPAHEDVQVVERMRARDATIIATDGAWVLTSGRQAGRAKGGYADYLRTQLVPTAPEPRAV
ncbi:glycosyltransferase [Glutamicibacter protophormiae]|uniref:glycosyltransferase n=1 Tax=Glutamicibacter protophormiae TaxID=37930 RepID=UPI003A92814B